MTTNFIRLGVEPQPCPIRQNRVNWEEAVEALERADGAWVRIIQATPNPRGARRLTELKSETEILVRRNLPRKDGQKTGFEIWARLKNEPVDWHKIWTE